MIFADYSGHFIAALLLVIFAVLMGIAFYTNQILKLRIWKWPLSLMQLASVVAFLFILWNPSRLEFSETARRNSVLVLFDTSQSMSVVEKGSINRLEKAIDAFEKTFNPSDNQGPNYQIYGFDYEPYFCESSDSLRQWGSQTNMNSIFRLLDRYTFVVESDELDVDQGHRGSKVVGAIIFSDGQADNKNVNTYFSPRNSDLQVIMVGVGSKDPKPDVEIKSIKAPLQVAIDTAYTVEVITTANNLKNQTVTIELLKDDYIIASKQISSDELSQSKKSEFIISADKLGRHNLLVRAKTSAQEINSANNFRCAMVQVVENSKLKVLFYSQAADFSFGKIRQALVRDKKIDLVLGLDAVITPLLADKNRTTCGNVKLPEDKAGFYNYDVIILGQCDVDNLTNAQIDGLYSFVVDRGGGLILLPGKGEFSPAIWKNEKIKTLIPIFFNTDIETIQSPGYGKMALTIEGIDSKIISQTDLKEDKELISTNYLNIDKKPAATIFATIADNPVITVHRVGRGRVCLVNISKLFELYCEDIDGGMLQKIFSGLTSYLGKVSSLEAAVELFAQRLPNEMNNIKFDAYVYDKSFAPVSGATVLLNFTDKVIHMDQVGQGHYAAKILNNTDEAIIATAQAQIDSVFLGEKTIAVNLPTVRIEMANIELDSKFLKELANKLGCKYFDIDDIDEDLAKMFEATTKTSSVNRMSSVWPRWSLLLSLCLLLSVTWFIRRSIGLV